MCIGLPMQVIAAQLGRAQCAGRGETRRVRTALVGDVAPGDWLLVFLDSAQERLDALRAAEINATLDLLQAAMASDRAHPSGDAPVAFALPSRWSAEQVRALSGTTHADTIESLS